MCLVDLTCAFVFVLITVKFVFESEEEGTDSKKTQTFHCWGSGMGSVKLLV